VFHNSYDGLQYKLTEEENTDNIDADVWGLELEARWRPSTNLDINFTYGFLNTNVKDFHDLDLLDATQGDSSLVALKDLDIATPATVYVASRTDVLDLTAQAISDGGAIEAPGAIYDDGIPLYFSRGYLEASGVPTSNGVLADLDGNDLPNAPPHQISLGIAYTWFLEQGALTARWDYYWQDKMYARYFNRPGDEIDAWEQHNASIVWTSSTGRWAVKAWIRNIEGEDNATGQFVSNENQGNFRNYFLTEPRVYGATLRFGFGGS
jgi:outer membrane receptor protein involved in Fe transport